MISQKDVEKKAEEYLKILIAAHDKKKIKLTELQLKLNTCAKKIQKAWKRYIREKKNRSAIKIQKIFQSWIKRKALYEQKIIKFRKRFYAGKIAAFIYIKYFSWKKNHFSIYDIEQNKFLLLPVPFSKNVLTYFPHYIRLYESFHSQIKYIENLRLYERKRFEISWEKYQKQLRNQMEKQTKKKWVQKDSRIWITQQNKPIVLQEYFQAQVQKLFKVQYHKYKSNDAKLENCVKLLQNKKQYFRQYYNIRLVSS